MVIRTRQGEREIRAFSLGNQVRYGFTDLRSLAGGFTEDAVHGIPALHRAARIRAEALASLRLCCWRGYGVDRKKVDTTWQARLLRGAPNETQTRFDFWETIGESLAYRGNAYIWKLVDPLTERVVEMYALHPDQVQLHDASLYDVTVKDGYVDPVEKGNGVYKNLDSSTILHIRGHGQGGKLEAPSPIAVFRETMNSALNRQRHETQMWKKGTALQLAVEFPQNVTQDQAKAWREMWTRTYEGTTGGTTAILGGGATIKPIGMTMKDAEFVAMANLTVEDASRIMGVPPNWLGRPTERANLFEQDLAIWLRLGLGPDLERVESAFGEDEQLFGRDTPNVASVYPKFDTEMFVRGDLLTEASILVQLVQAGILLPDEARQIRGLDELPDGMGQIPQITPVGGAPNPNAQPALVAPNGNGKGEGY